MNKNLHAHVSFHSRDCDGLYDRSHVSVPGDQTESAFQATLRDLYKPTSPDGYFLETHDGFEWSEPTEEGFSSGEVIWCTRDDADEPNTFRDHTAESMGY